jgi:hypothetical protein
MVLMELLALLLQTGPVPSSSAATAAAPELLEEPGYFIDQGDKWRLRKPKLRVLEPQRESLEAWKIFEDENRASVERRMKTLPRLRLNRALVSYNPITRQRTTIEDWTGENDSREIEADIQSLIQRFAPTGVRELLPAAPLYMARLNGAAGHTAEEPSDARKFVIYLDPFEATGRLHAASTLVHELSHLERYRRRGFHANRSAAVLSKADFILLGAVDELAGYQAEAALIEAFLKSTPSDVVSRAVRKWMPLAHLRWPLPLRLLLGYEGQAERPSRMKKAREQVVLELQSQASRYWDFHHKDSLDPALAATIREWYAASQEWKEISGQRREWIDAVTDAMGTD